MALDELVIWEYSGRMDVESLIARVRAEPNRQALADATGLRYMHLYKLAKGWVKKPRAKTIEVLRKHYAKQDK